MIIRVKGYLVNDQMREFVSNRPFPPGHIIRIRLNANGDDSVAGKGNAAGPLLGEDHRAAQVR